MPKIKTAINLLKTPYKLVPALDANRLIDWMPDSIFLRMSFKGNMGYRLDLKNPKTFNEKLQWLKLYDRKTKYTTLVDKIQAKKEIGDIIGNQFIVPLLGTWKSAYEIDFNSLPNQFVLKCNHDQGSVVIVSDKNRADFSNIITFLENKLKKNAYYGTREYPYKNIHPLIFAESFLGDNIIDYKFYCFNGVPKFLYCGQGLTSDHTLKIDFYDLKWNLMPFYRTDYPRLGQIKRPARLSEMIEIAKRLSCNIPFVRIDLFEVDNSVYFSEFTLYPASGYMPFVPEKYDRIIGEWIKLPDTI